MERNIEDLITHVQETQKTYGQCAKTGEFKKEKVKQIFKEKLLQLSLSPFDEEEHEFLKDFIDYYLDPLIDSVVWIAKNKEITKLFKKSCS
jgi:hypothetical protein